MRVVSVAKWSRRGTPRQYRRVAVLIAVTDYLAILAAFLVADVIRFRFRATPFDFLAVIAVAPPAWLVIFGAFRLYSLQRFASAEEFRRVILAVTLGITAIAATSYWTKSEMSRVWIGLSWILALAFVLAVRRAWHHQIWRLRRKGRLTFRTLIVGTNDEAVHLADVMGRRKVGFEAIGFVSTGNGRAEGSLPVVGDIPRLQETIRNSDAECVFVASSALRTDEMRVVTRSARLENVEVRVSANIPEMLSSRLAAQPLGGVMAFSVWPVRLSGFQAAAKRSFDLVLSSLTLVLTVPLWIPIALAVGLTSRGPVLYRQTRVGRRGRTFTLLKFRTMVTGADTMIDSLREHNEAKAPLFKIRNDARVTPAGRWLRRWSLDELPQLLNVVRGDMSIVGPRPPLPEEVAAYEEWHRDRLEVRPGITGLWQVSGRSDLSFDDYVRLDLFYIENWSLAYDLYLLAKTGPAVFSRKGAF